MALRRCLQILFSAIAAGLCAVSLAGATSIKLSGTDNPSAYMVALGDTDPIPVTVVTTPATPWAPGSWITYINPDQSWPMDTKSGNPPGTYHYLTMFELGGLDATTAVIKGAWASDNGSQLLLNGNLVGTIPGTNDTGFQSLTDFTITSANGLLSNTNFLEFVVTNYPWGDGPNPTGLLVDIYQATADPVPEPSTIFLLSAGIMGACILRSRVRK